MTAFESTTVGHSPAETDAGDRSGIFELAARDTCVREARQKVHAQLSEWSFDEDTRDAAALVVSELVTNALLHTESKVIVCVLREERDRLRIEVTDQGEVGPGPAPQIAAADQEHGRGLLLVTRLADAWGVVTASSGRGRSVWVLLRSAAA